VDVGNTLGSDIKICVERTKVGLATYVHIYVQVDFNKGSLDKMILKKDNYKWIETLDFENTIF